jgi:hypothetical protein
MFRHNVTMHNLPVAGRKQEVFWACEVFWAHAVRLLQECEDA